MAGNKFNIEPIDDVSSEESYIVDLEHEVTTLRAKVLKLQKAINSEGKVNIEQQDKSCCSAYKLLQKSYQKLINDLLPF